MLSVDSHIVILHRESTSFTTMGRGAEAPPVADKAKQKRAEQTSDLFPEVAPVYLLPENVSSDAARRLCVNSIF